MVPTNLQTLSQKKLIIIIKILVRSLNSLFSILLLKDMMKGLFIMIHKIRILKHNGLSEDLNSHRGRSKYRSIMMIRCWNLMLGMSIKSLSIWENGSSIR